MDIIKATKGVDNVVLTQRDGNPIQHSGIWLSKDELFSICAATSAIYNCGLSLHRNNLQYILIEGKIAKILISPLRNYGTPTINKIIQAQNLQGVDDEFYVAITTRANVNLGGIFLKIRSCLMNIKKSLILSGESFKPPKRHYSKEDIEKIINSSGNKEELDKNERVSLNSFSIEKEIYDKMDNILVEFGKNTLDLINSYISLDGGFVLSSFYNDQLCNEHTVETEATLSNSLFYTADKCAWLLKKMHITSILLECVDEFQFINNTKNAIFSAKIAKGRQKLGLLRLIIPKYCNKINKIFEEQENTFSGSPSLEIGTLFSQLSF